MTPPETVFINGSDEVCEGVILRSTGSVSERFILCLLRRQWLAALECKLILNPEITDKCFGGELPHWLFRQD
jgi:hypothetical protein